MMLIAAGGLSARRRRSRWSSRKQPSRPAQPPKQSAADVPIAPPKLPVAEFQGPPVMPPSEPLPKLSDEPVEQPAALPAKPPVKPSAGARRQAALHHPHRQTQRRPLRPDQGQRPDLRRLAETQAGDRHHRHGGRLHRAVRLRRPGSDEGGHGPPLHLPASSIAKKAGRWWRSTWAALPAASAARRK